jgi:hypothetical protein
MIADLATGVEGQMTDRMQKAQPSHTGRPELQG